MTEPTQNRKIKKGELLFAEGEGSRAMYYLKNGIVRIFKKKGESHIEIETIHSGQILGELSFLDGNPRSASGEALVECELVEISGPTFSAVLSGIPEWLKILLKTVVMRLRTASTRIRQLETASSAYDYSDKDGGKRTSHYVFLSTPDVLKLSSAVLLVGSRGIKPSADGIELRIPMLNRYANQVMGIPLAKLTILLDILAQVEALKTIGDGAAAKYFLCNPDFLESFIVYLSDESQLEPAKRHDLSAKGFLIMGLIAKHVARYPANPESGLASVNLAEVRKLETSEGGKEPFHLEEFPELVKVGYATEAKIQSASVVLTQIKSKEFLRAFKFQQAVMAVSAANEQKGKGFKAA